MPSRLYICFLSLFSIYSARTIISNDLSVIRLQYSNGFVQEEIEGHDGFTCLAMELLLVFGKMASERESMSKNLVILGSTGSIGTQTLDVVAQNSGRSVSVLALAANRQVALLAKQIETFRPQFVSVGTSQAAAKLETLLGEYRPKEILIGRDGLVQLAQLPEADQVVVATVGAVGTLPTLAALRAGKPVALANKEVLVMGGDLVNAAVAEYGAALIPIDSEHSAIFQCLCQSPPEEVENLLLTGSGGPFRTWPRERIAQATIEEALNHPNWSMGNKITIDSATLMNKGLEFIEAMHLFSVEPEQIKVVIHPQSVIHSLVEFRDGSIMAQLGMPDMRVPIQYALSYPERWDSDFPRLNLLEAARLDFEEPDMEKFPCLRLAVQSAAEGGTRPAILSVANEEAVSAFLKGRIPFGKIAATIEAVLKEQPREVVESVEQLLEIETSIRRKTREKIERTEEPK